MQDESTPVVSPLVPRHGVLVLTGYGLRVAVERGQLAVSDGFGDERRTGRFARATCGIKRLIILGHTGTISLEALRWLHDIGASITQIDADGEALLTSGPVGLDDARLRRAQALAPTNGVGTAITRDLLRRKFDGHLAVLAQLPETDDARARIAQLMGDLDAADTPGDLRRVEATAAKTYWQAWSPVAMRFGKRDAAKVPDHWRFFGSRASQLTGSPRNASNPINALFNYLYAIVESEARIAALAVGLDPGMGVLHADQQARDSLACDLMEVVRPQVDAWVLTMLQTRTFRATDFFETRQGGTRVLPPLTQLLAETALQWRKAIAPVAERVAQWLFTGSVEPQATKKVKGLPTKLTETNRSAGRDAVHGKQRKRQTAKTLAVLPHTCAGCGGPVPYAKRRYCDACTEERRVEHFAEWTTQGIEVLAQLRADGRDPGHGGEAARKRSATHVQRMEEAREWDAEHEMEHDPEVFIREILPKLQNVSLNELMKVTGLSKQYCSLIRRGLKVPHPRHWHNLIITEL